MRLAAWKRVLQTRPALSGGLMPERGVLRCWTGVSRETFEAEQGGFVRRIWRGWRARSQVDAESQKF